MSEHERQKQIERICQNLAAMTEDQFQEFLDILRAEHEDIWSVFEQKYNSFGAGKPIVS